MLEDFLREIENDPVEKPFIAQQQITYPFLYVNRISQVELKTFKASGLLHFENLSADDIPFMLEKETGGFIHIGWITLCFESFIQLRQLYARPYQIKKSKTEIISLESLADMLLLKGV